MNITVATCSVQWRLVNSLEDQLNSVLLQPDLLKAGVLKLCDTVTPIIIYMYLCVCVCPQLLEPGFESRQGQEAFISS
jgi:hypothetical protein